MKKVAIAKAAVETFLLESAGNWRSQRRYYTLNSNKDPMLEATTEIEVLFLTGDRPELSPLAELHQLDSAKPFLCGAKVRWTGVYTNIIRKPLEGETIFGIRGDLMYRDRGFSTSQPVTAKFELPNPQVMRLFTSYDGANFEEEIRLVGHKHRTRQTIISKAGRGVMVGQYLETRH
ncbi:MAG: phycobiliprotein lyase [Limnothrix sp. RL_2_0]|nr:phycobiliprotein lyase [Limnothrix sp. RL_2_0]